MTCPQTEAHLSGAAPPARFAPRRLGHANLFVGDVERSARFYHAVCGLELVRREPAITAAFLSNGNTHHDVGLIQVSPEARRGRDGFVQPSGTRGKRPGLNHLGFEMETEADLVAAWERAVAARVPIHSTADHIISRSVYLFDPSGTLLEFYADALADWRTVFNPEQEDLVSGAWTPGATPPARARNYPVDPEIRVVPEALLHARKIAYAVLEVPRLADSLAFYQEVAGLAVVARDGAGRGAVLRGSAGSFDLVLFEARAGASGGLHHFAFEHPGLDLGAAKRRLGDAGVVVDFEVDGPAKQSLFVRDPDGMLVEFTERQRALLAGPIPDDVRLL